MVKGYGGDTFCKGNCGPGIIALAFNDSATKSHDEIKFKLHRTKSLKRGTGDVADCRSARCLLNGNYISSLSFLSPLSLSLSLSLFTPFFLSQWFREQRKKAIEPRRFNADEVKAMGIERDRKRYERERESGKKNAGRVEVKSREVWE